MFPKNFAGRRNNFQRNGWSKPNPRNYRFADRGGFQNGRVTRSFDASGRPRRQFYRARGNQLHLVQDPSNDLENFDFDQDRLLFLEDDDVSFTEIDQTFLVVLQCEMLGEEVNF